MVLPPFGNYAVLPPPPPPPTLIDEASLIPLVLETVSSLLWVSFILVPSVRAPLAPSACDVVLTRWRCLACVRSPVLSD